MPYTVRMPQLGESVAEGTISRWFKQVGDRVEEDENLLEISTDKVETEIPSPASGWISEILVAEGETVAVGTDLCVISETPPAEVASRTEAPAGAQAEVAAPDQVAPAGAQAEVAAPDQEGVQREAATEAAVGASAQTPGGEGVGAFEEAVGTVASPAQFSEAPGDSRSTMRLRWEPGRTHELHARPSEPREAPPPLESQRLHAQPSLPRDRVPTFEGTSLHAQPSHPQQAAPPAPPKPHARVTPEGLRRLEHPELGEEVKPGGSRRGIYSPAVRKKAKELGVDLDRIVGTGAGGRITLKDVEAAASGEAPAAAPQAEVAAGAEAAPAPKAAPSLAGRGTTVTLSTMRRRIAEHMTEARRTAAHCFECLDVDVEKVEAARQAYKEEFRQKHGFSLTYLPFFSLAVCNALLEFPFVNSRIDLEAGTMTLFEDFVNLGIAVDLDGEGLIVPVVHDAHLKTVWELARRINDLSERARRKALVPDEVSGGTFTITNPGSFGTRLSVPIINTPEVAILSLEAVEDRPVARGGQVEVRKMTTIGLSWDHRAFDGADAARFLQAVRRRIEGEAEGWDWDVLAAPDV